ncbi:pectin acetylesterase-family hydrolase [Pendulispora albinea]|uniref:Pectinacetylesterase family protein n=1 Tax=Pendulispora albinea TaxID=2741071 RepID=A0ABZ2LLD5_9BACT
MLLGAAACSSGSEAKPGADRDGGVIDISGDDAGGAFGEAPTCPPSQPGIPIITLPNTWTWIPVPEAKCRDGKPTGMGVRLKPGSKKLFIYLQGGGACFNGASCGLTASSFDRGGFDSWKDTYGHWGIMNDANPKNPVKDWSAVFIPYCSGDIFGGSVESANVPSGPPNQRFTGVANMNAYLKRIIGTFSDVDQVLLTGSSAGGYGASVSYDRVATALCPRPVVLIDDAGPILSDSYFAPCLQKRLRGVWNLDATLPSGCRSCGGADASVGGGMVNAVPYVIRQFPKGRFGLISSNQDWSIRQFMSFGENNCAALDGIPLGYDGAKFSKGLLELRDVYLKPAGNAGTYFVSGDTHTFLTTDAFFSTTVQNVALPDWVAGLLRGDKPGHVGP